MQSPCPICSAGLRGFRLCSDGVSVVLMCDECDAVWLDPARVDASEVVYPEPPEFLVEGRECSIAAPPGQWATRTQIDAAGWAEFVHAHGVAADGG